MLAFFKEAFADNLPFAVYICSLVTIFGLVIGSFLNVVGLRFLSGESIVLPPSKCPKCKTKLKWYDNIPIFAYLFLGGRCRYCKEAISPQYPIVEALTGAVFLAIFLKFGFAFATLALWALAGFCIVMCITDFKEQIIFDATSIPLIPLGLVYSFFNLGNLPSETVQVLGVGISSVFLSAIYGVFAGFLIFEIISLVSKIFIKHRAFGEGDTIIAMFFGAWLGLEGVLLTVLISLFVQTIFTLPFMVMKLFKIKDKAAIVSFGVLIFAAILPLILNQFDFFYTTVGSLILILGTISLALVSALAFLRRMRELNAFTMLPFGPALIVAGFVVLFFCEEISKFLGV